MSQTSLTAIDCFAGAGGISLGLRWAGFDVRVAFDIDQPAVTTYRKNLGEEGHVLDIKETSGEKLLDLASLKPAECDLLVGGPPCQGFSTQRRGDDKDDRNDLVLEFMRLIREIKPRAFLMENVPALSGRRGKHILAHFRETVESEGLGYTTYQDRMDAADFGVPQHRRRLFVVGLTDDLPFQWPKPTHDASNWVTVRDAIGGLRDPRSLSAEQRLPNHDPDNISEQNRMRISFVPEGGGRADIPMAYRLPCHQVSVDVAGHRAVYGRLWWDRPSATITTKCNSFTRGRFAHPVEDRNISMREAARLQGFRDDFVFLGGRVDVAHQVGNAVPPPLAMILGEALAKHLAGA